MSASEWMTECDQITEWLGDMAEAYNVTDCTDEQTTLITIDVETLARRVAERIAARQAEDLATVKRACDAECKSPGKHTGCSSHEPYRVLASALGVVAPPTAMEALDA